MQRNINIARPAALLAFAITVAPNAVAGQPKADPEPPPVARVQHVPLHEVVSGTIKLTFRVTHPQLVASVVVYYRRSPAGGGSVQVHERIARRAGKSENERPNAINAVSASRLRPIRIQYASWVAVLDSKARNRTVEAEQISQTHQRLSDSNGGERRSVLKTSTVPTTTHHINSSMSSSSFKMAKPANSTPRNRANPMFAFFQKG